MLQTKEKDKTLEEGNIPEKAFKVMIVKMIKELRRRMDEQKRIYKCLIKR